MARNRAAHHYDESVNRHSIINSDADGHALSDFEVLTESLKSVIFLSMLERLGAEDIR